ncbi:MAG TPA: pyridoxamine 5'-phosphate oxidase family protein [Jatrophihabitans sp.]|nr:pyridoxamine 5'-phosphate oxidase family protein [Jatrophihabitans sp.]
MRWSDLLQSQPELAELGRRKLLDPGVALVATIRRDGSPRLSAVEPFVLAGELLLSMLLGSTKAADLLRDPRLLVHSVITSRDGGDGEFKLRGTARAQTDPDIQRRYSEAVAESLGWRPVPGRFHLFAVEVEDVTFISYDDATGDQFVARWPAGDEYVRRGTSATTLGQPEERRELLRR